MEQNYVTVTLRIHDGMSRAKKAAKRGCDPVLTVAQDGDIHRGYKYVFI